MAKQEVSKERVSTLERRKKDKQWYKDHADSIDTQHYGLTFSTDLSGISDYKIMKVNYDLFNSKINIKDFSYVCQPYGPNIGELPARMENRDIVSPKIKSLLGMEMKRPFSWTVLAVNPEATTRKEQKQLQMYKDYINDTIMMPIRQQIEVESQQQLQGKQLTPEEQQKIKAQVEQQVESKTPEEIKKYMLREHQDPAEIQANQLLNYIIQKEDLKNRFNMAYKHGLLSGLEVAYVGILNGEPVCWNVNSMRFNCSKSPDLQTIEDSEYASCEYRMTPSQIIRFFGDQLTPAEIDKIYQKREMKATSIMEDWFYRSDSMVLDEDYMNTDNETVRVLHCVWKSLRKLGFLTYIDEEGNEQQKIVSEEYRLNEKLGDVSLEWEWLPECCEAWKIDTDIYVNCRPVPGQFKDINNMWNCKLPYYGVIYDNTNSRRVALMDRLRPYQYYYNIIMYKLELLLASDKGKKVMMNIDMIPDEAGIDMEQWKYFFESSPFMWYNTKEEGARDQESAQLGKVIDLSLASDIKKYMEVAEYLRTQCGRVVGITDQVEGQIAPREAVSNTRQNMVQSSYLLEPYFNLHSLFKKNVLTALLECAKVAYSGRKAVKLSYMLDDMTMHMLELDTELLENSTYGLYVTDSAKADEIKETIKQLAHAALQNQQVDFSDVIAILRKDDILEAEETLKVSEENKKKEAQAAQESQQQAQQQANQAAQEFEKQKHEWEKELTVLKEEERRKTVVVQGSFTAASFNPEQEDEYMERANKQIELGLKERQASDKEKNTSMKERELSLKEKQASDKKSYDNKKLDLEKQKINKVVKKP